MQVAVVIPVYKNNLSVNEHVALSQCLKILAAYPLVIVKPQSLEPQGILAPQNFSDIISFDDSCFTSVSAYNRLMLSAEFYKAFSIYEYILIHQLDAFVFRDELSEWCSRGFDYIGAPWIRIRDNVNPLHIFSARLSYWIYTHLNLKKIGIKGLDELENQVGNGGFSLRSVAKFAALCDELSPVINSYLNHNQYQFNEDIFWSVETNRGKKRLEIPGWRTALKFAFEIAPERARNLNNGNLPFGCHAWDRNIDYWRPIFRELGYSV